MQPKDAKPLYDQHSLKAALTFITKTSNRGITENESDLRSNEHYLSSSDREA